MGDLDATDPVRDALSGLATPLARPPEVVLDGLRPAMGRARMRRRVQVASTTAVTLAALVVGGLSVRGPTPAQQVQIADEPSRPTVTMPPPEISRTTPSTTTATPTTVAPTTAAPAETTVVSPIAEVASPPDDDRDPAPAPPREPGPERPAVPPVTAPPAGPPPTTAAPVPAPDASEVLVISAGEAGSISVRSTTSAIIDVDVTPSDGYSYEIEDRTVHEVKVIFEGGGSRIEVEIHLEDGRITHQIEGDE